MLYGRVRRLPSPRSRSVPASARSRSQRYRQPTPNLGIRAVSRREHDQLVVIELRVRPSDERLVARAVVPLQKGSVAQVLLRDLHDALGIIGRAALFLVVVFVDRDALEEGCRRQLLACRRR